MLQGGHERVTDRQTDGQTDRQTDRRTDRQTGWIQYTPPNFVVGGIIINEDKKMIFKHQLCASLCSCPVDDITIDSSSSSSAFQDLIFHMQSRSDYRVHYNCGECMWKMICDTLNISFIQGGIHGLLCKKLELSQSWTKWLIYKPSIGHYCAYTYVLHKWCQVISPHSDGYITWHLFCPLSFT